MAVSVKRIKLWRREVDNRPGAMAETLEPLAQTGANLKVVMGYRYPGNPNVAAIELFPVSGGRAAAAAQRAGLAEAPIAAVLVEGDNRAGLGYAITRGLADEGVNIEFLVAQVMGRRYTAVFGFDNEAVAKRATALIKQASRVARPPKAARRTTAARTSTRRRTARKGSRRRH